MTRRTRQGAPDNHITDAPNGPQAGTTIPLVMHAPSDLARENRKRALALGFMVGFAVAAWAFALLLWLWVVPTMDWAVETAKAAAL